MTDPSTSADELSRMAPDVQSRLARDLDASRVALRAVAPMLYLARGIYLGELGQQVDWGHAPADVKRDLIRVAEQAVRSVLTQHRHDAERQAQLIYREAVRGALRGVLEAAIAYDPIQEHHIRRILSSAEQALLSYTRDDIAASVIRMYLDGLVIPGLERGE